VTYLGDGREDCDRNEVSQEISYHCSAMTLYGDGIWGKQNGCNCCYSRLCSNEVRSLCSSGEDRTCKYKCLQRDEKASREKGVLSQCGVLTKPRNGPKLTFTGMVGHAFPSSDLDYFRFHPIF